jgi:hypothetical protein
MELQQIPDLAPQQVGEQVFIDCVLKASPQARPNMFDRRLRVPILRHLVHQQLKGNQRDLTWGVSAGHGKQALVEQVLHILSHFLAPGARLRGRERLPKLGKTLDGFPLVD